MKSNARQVCENFLRMAIRYNIENDILASENRVAERLLERGSELSGVYDEIYDKLHNKPLSLEQLLGMFLSFQAFWGPKQIAKARMERQRLEHVNVKIEKLARTLAELVEERSALENTSGFSSYTIDHIGDVIDRGGVKLGHYQLFLRPEMDRLREKYDTKYWPSLASCLMAVAEDAAKAFPRAMDPLTNAATKSKRASTSDSVMGFIAYIDECRGNFDGSLPEDFYVSDKSMATIMSVLLDLGADKALTAEYIKGCRQRLRGRVAHSSI